MSFSFKSEESQSRLCTLNELHRLAGAHNDANGSSFLDRKSVPLLDNIPPIRP